MRSASSAELAGPTSCRVTAPPPCPGPAGPRSWTGQRGARRWDPASAMAGSGGPDLPASAHEMDHQGRSRRRRRAADRSARPAAWLPCLRWRFEQAHAQAPDGAGERRTRPELISVWRPAGKTRASCIKLCRHPRASRRRPWHRRQARPLTATANRATNGVSPRLPRDRDVRAGSRRVPPGSAQRVKEGQREGARPVPRSSVVPIRTA